MNQPKRIILMTATGGYNLGDELILLAEYTYLRARYPHAHMSVWTYDPASSLLPIEDSITYLTYFPADLYKKPFQNIVYCIKNILDILRSDMIIIGGGELIYDTEIQQTRSPMLYWMFRVFFARLFHVPIVYFNIGINLPTIPSRRIGLLFGGNHTSALVRDQKSADILSINNLQSTVCDDSVFLLDTRTSSMYKKDSHTKPRIGLALRHGYIPHEQSILQLLYHFFDSRGWDVVFLTHSFHATDPLAHDGTWAADMGYRGYITQSLRETLACYGDLDAVIGMRLHSLILSCVHDVPFFALSYSKKTDELLKRLEYPHYINTQNIEYTLLEEQLQIFLQSLSERKFDLGEKSATIKNNCTAIINAHFDGLESSPRKHR